MMLAMERGFHIVNGNVRRVALQPVARSRAAVVAAADVTAATTAAVVGDNERALLSPALAVMTSPATLMANPKSLYDVWNEYRNGVGGGSLQGFSPKLSEGRSSLSTRDEKRFGTWFAIWSAWATRQIGP
jgi:hypothetical protein